VLSNLGLSYVLSKDLPKAEETLRRANSRPGADPRVRLNLALVIGLQGRLAEAESLAKADRPAEEAAANVAYIKRLLSRKENARAEVNNTKVTASTPPDRPAD
jgi:Flp pilus assembly protein TadD